MSTGFIAAAWTFIKTSLGDGMGTGVWVRWGGEQGVVYVRDVFDSGREEFGGIVGYVCTAIRMRWVVQ